VLPEPKDARRRTIFFTPGSDGDIELTIAAAGLSGDIELAVAASSLGTTAKGRIRASVKSQERILLDVTFSEPFEGPIELAATSVTSSEIKRAA
jgi:hypothetical protein